MNRIISSAAFAALLAWAPASLAQAAGSPAAAEEVQDYADDDLKTFANALVEVSRINDNYFPIYEAARSPREQEAIELKASEEMVRALQNVGLTVGKYQQIMARARTNPEMANRINEHVKDAVNR
jgi:hypothetical protein